MKRIPNYKIQLVREGSSLYNTNQITCPEDAAEIAARHFEAMATDREVFSVMFLNVKNYLRYRNTRCINWELNRLSGTPKGSIQGRLPGKRREHHPDAQPPFRGS